MPFKEKVGNNRDGSVLNDLLSFHGAKVISLYWLGDNQIRCVDPIKSVGQSVRLQGVNWNTGSVMIFQYPREDLRECRNLAVSNDDYAHLTALPIPIHCPVADCGTDSKSAIL